MSILIQTIRVFGFRGLNNIEVSLEPTTVITGMNNSGKTSFLKALQIVFGNRQFLTHDDFHINDTSKADQIIIDVKIIPIGSDKLQVNTFIDDWETLFTEDRIRNDVDGKQFIVLRTIVKIDALTNTYKTNQYIQQEWLAFKNGEDLNWYQSENGTEKAFHFEEIPFFYIDAQRDIIDDMTARNSYLGKMLSNIKYSPENIRMIEEQIAELNKQAVEGSDILSNIETALKELDTAMDNTNNGVAITPFPKKVRDLNKGISILYSDFAMEYHGMGTRSWSSLLTMKSFISLFAVNSQINDKPYFAVVAIEEPEAHLHPNAQKKLFSQIDTIPGQKIISTHSPYIAASAELGQIRNFYKEQQISCGRIETSNFSTEDLRKIKRQVINTRGELFFSKVMVFFEGETEEQALPIFAGKHYGKISAELGIDFIGVGGHGNYLPFIRFAEALNIPWFIFSDAEAAIKESVLKQFIESASARPENECIYFVNDGNNFETQLFDDNFEDEVRKAIKSIELPKCDNERHANAKNIEIDGYDRPRLLEILTASKTQFGPAVAEAIVQSGKDLPPKIVSLFDRIKETIYKREE